MVNVFVAGGNGYIGKAVAIALRRAGHNVTALVRNKDQGLALIKEEVKFAVGALEAKLDEKVFGPLLDAAAVVIDTTFSQPVSLHGVLHKAVIAAAKRTGQRKRYIFTSGILVYGDHPGQVLTEDIVPTNKFLGERAAFEKEVITPGDVDGIVIRPAYVYGGTMSGFLGEMFAVNGKSEIEIVGSPDKSWSSVHITDLANAYVLVVEAPRALVTGEIFDVADDTRLTYQQVREAFVKQAGHKVSKVVVLPLPDVNVDVWSHIQNVTIITSAAKIKRVVGWQPKNGPLLDNLPTFYEAMVANKGKA